MEWAWTSSDNERDRQNAVTLSNLAAGRERSQAEYQQMFHRLVLLVTL